MTGIISLLIVISSALSFFLGIFFFSLYLHLRKKHQEHLTYYCIYSILAVGNGLWLGGFAGILNMQGNLPLLDFANRMVIILSPVLIILMLHFLAAYLNLFNRRLFLWLYCSTLPWTILAVFSNTLFLKKEFFATSRYYTGLAYGPLFQAWGVYILLLSLVVIVLYLKYYRRSRQHHGIQYINFFLVAVVVWLFTGLMDDLTGIQVIDLPPFGWLGSLLIQISIARLLVLQIDYLYVEKGRLYEEVIHDALTGVYSRSFFEVRLQDFICCLARQQTSLFLVMFDIDNFKKINDRNGHAAGDQVLKQIAGTITSILRPTDVLARLGGDEFGILLFSIENETDAQSIIERIRHQIEQQTVLPGGDGGQVTCSFGMTQCRQTPGKQSELHQLFMEQADQALYASKRNGRNRLTFYKTDNQNTA